VERRAAHLSPAASRPRPAAWLELLQDARRRAQDWASQVEEWLEPVSGDYSRAEAETAAWNERLAALCAPFPAAGDEAAWLRLVLAPWRWPRLGWAAAVAIPAAVEELRRAQARLLRARSDEANLHAVRQLVLVMAQDLADAAGEAAALWGDVLQAAEALAGCPEPPAPWRLPAVRELAAGLAPRSGPDLAVLSAAAPGEPPEVAWLAWAHTRLGPVAGWDAAAWLAEAGYAVEETEPPHLEEAPRLWRAITTHEMRAGMDDLVERHGDDGIRRAIAGMKRGVPALDAEGYVRALARRTALVRDWSLFLERWPIVLGPVCAEPAFPWGLDVDTHEGMDRVTRAQGPQFLVPLLGLPALAAPLGRAEGVPIGVQLVGARFREDLLLDAAEVLEARHPSPTPIDPVRP